MASADRLIDRLHDLFALYASRPEVGALVPHLQEGLRHFSSGNYVVFYFPQEAGIAVIRILHGARNIEQLFRL